MNPGEDTDLDQILRARRTAERQTVDVDGRTVVLLVFSLGTSWFALPGASVREIVPRTEVFYVPGCPGSLEGVINVRGDIESVVNLKGLLGEEAAPDGAILVGRAAGFQSGVRVDRVLDVIEVAEDALQPPHSALPEAVKALVTGIAVYKDTAVPVLDLGRIFTALLDAPA